MLPYRACFFGCRRRPVMRRVLPGKTSVSGLFHGYEAKGAKSTK